MAWLKAGRGEVVGEADWGTGLRGCEDGLLGFGVRRSWSDGLG